MPKTLKAVGWQPTVPPSKAECRAMQQIVKEAIYGLYNQSGEPLKTFQVNLYNIYLECQRKIRKLRKHQEWRYPYRGKRTWDRRVNEVGEHGHIVAVKAGWYRPRFPNYKLVQRCPKCGWIRPKDYTSSKCRKCETELMVIAVKEL